MSKIGKSQPPRKRSTGSSKTVLNPEVLPADSKRPSSPTVPLKVPAEEAEYTEEARSEEEGSTSDDFHDDEHIEAEAEDAVRQNLPATAPRDRDPSRVERPLEEDESSTALSSTDPLRRYLEEVRRHPLLSPEEEYRLALQLKESGSIDAAKRLVQANLRLVAKIAFEYRSFYSNVLDLIQEGNVGLMKAVSKFDPTRGAKLSYYASWWIRSYILKYLLDNFRLVRVGTTQAQKKLFYHLMREKDRLEAQGLLAGPKLLAERLDVREKDVIEMEQRLSARGGELSLDAPLTGKDGEGTTTHGDLLVDPQEAADSTLARDQLLKLLQENLPLFEKILNPRELEILHDRILAEEPKTLQEIADRHHLTRERTRQIEARVLEKLRKFLAPTLGSTEETQADSPAAPLRRKPLPAQNPFDSDDD